MSSSETKKHIKITDIISIEYEDFLMYCNNVGKMFSDEITPVDYVAYRSRYGRDKSEVKQLRTLIEAGDVLDRSNNTSEETALTSATGMRASIPNDESLNEVHNPQDEAELIVESIGEVEVTSSPSESLRMDTVANSSDSTYAEIFGMNADAYAHIYIESDLYGQYSVALSARSLNCLRKAGCISLKDLLLLTPGQLSKTRTLGAKSIKEIEAGLLNISKQLPPYGEEVLLKSGYSIRKNVLRPIVGSMLCRKPYSEEELTENEKVFLSIAIEAAELLGNDLCTKLMFGENYQYIEVINKMFLAFHHKTIFCQRVVDRAKIAVSTWDTKILSNWLFPYMRLFFVAGKAKISNEFTALLKKEVTVGEYAELVETEIDSNVENFTDLAKDLELFEKWMNGIDLGSICEKIFSQNELKSERVFEVLYARATGHTLEEIAQQYGLTRERVRQIEKKGLRIIEKRLSNNKYNLIALISAFRNGDYVLLKGEIIETIGTKYANLLWYCATRIKDKGPTYLMDSNIVHYDKMHDAIIVFHGDILENDAAVSINDTSEELIAKLPDLIETSTLKMELEGLAEKHGLSLELFQLAANKQYKTAGIYSYKGRLTVIQMCDFILKNRFQNGYKIADATDSGLFMKCLAEFFGEKGHMTARAIDAKVMGLGVLIDRGKYIHKDYISVDKSIVDEIFTYIESSPKAALSYSEIFAALERLFDGTAITNRYVLQGVMKLYDCPYASHRDYISKKQNGNVADELNTFVKANRMVHKSEIFDAFPGWKDYNLAFVLLRCPEVIGIDNGFFIHSSSLVVSEDTHRSIREYLNTVIQDIPVSARYLQDEFMIRFPEFMIENDIQTHGKLFGILQYMFAKEYHFSRPYIAKENIGEITNKSVLLKHLEEIESIELSDFVDLCKQNAVYYVSISYLLDMMQPEFVRIDDRTLMRFENIGFNEEMYQDVIELISEAVSAHNGYIAVSNINDFSWYPMLNISWTPFLLESIANMIPREINIVKMLSSSSDVPHSIFVSDEYADDDWNSLLVKLLKVEHAIEPFTTKAAILDWLQAEGLCNVKYPAYLDTENHVYFDGDGKLRIK